MVELLSSLIWSNNHTLFSNDIQKRITNFDNLNITSTKKYISKKPKKNKKYCEKYSIENNISKILR